MKKYKVLRSDLTSPFKGFQYKIGKEYICEDFDDSNTKCSRGFYATDIEGLTYSLRSTRKVFEVEVSGKSRCFDQFKQRFEKQTIIREVPEAELKDLIKVESDKLSYDLYHAIYPVNPLDIEAGEVTDEVKQLLEDWIKVRISVSGSFGDSVYGSVRYSVRYSVWDSVRNSVWDSVRGSVSDSIYAYIGSLFTEIKEWKDIYPYQPAVDLWHKGFVPSFDGEVWRLHTGKDAKVVYERNF